MIQITLKNAPAGAPYWLPIFMYNGVALYPKENGEPKLLTLSQGWVVDIVGNAQFRVDILDSNGDLLNQTNFEWYTFNEGENYVWNWLTSELEMGSAIGGGSFPWKTALIGAGVIVGTVAVVAATRK